MIKKLKCTKGFAITWEFLLFILILFGIIFASLEISRHTSRQSDLQQIANILSNQIESTGRVDSSTDAYFKNLCDTFNMSAEYEVDGDIRNGKLGLESHFTVSVIYKTNLKIGMLNYNKEKTYVAKSIGISEYYHK